MDQVRSTGKEMPFAKSILKLLEVTTRISQLDELMVDALSAGETETPETSKWKEISAMSGQFARTSLVDRQLAAIDELLDISVRGGSLVKEASEQSQQRVEHGPLLDPLAQPVVGASAGVGDAAPPMGLAAPPGLPAPPGLGHLAPLRGKPRAGMSPHRFEMRAPKSAGARATRPWTKGVATHPATRIDGQEDHKRPRVFASTLMALNLQDYDDA